MLVVMAGCPIPRDQFATTRADALCDVQKRCQRGEYHVDWTNREQCVSHTAQDLRVELADQDWCGYDAAEARRCVERVRSLDCDRWSLGGEEEACDLVFDCSE
jgi:hypothetical protein